MAFLLPIPRGEEWGSTPGSCEERWGRLEEGARPSPWLGACPAAGILGVDAQGGGMRGCGGLDECRAHEGPCSLAAALGGGAQVGAAGRLERGQGPAGVATLRATKIELEAVSPFPSVISRLIPWSSLRHFCRKSLFFYLFCCTLKLSYNFFPGCFKNF